VRNQNLADASAQYVIGVRLSSRFWMVKEKHHYLLVHRLTDMDTSVHKIARLIAIKEFRSTQGPI
jgi:hypothetical protein